MFAVFMWHSGNHCVAIMKQSAGTEQNYHAEEARGSVRRKNNSVRQGTLPHQTSPFYVTGLDERWSNRPRGMYNNVPRERFLSPRCNCHIAKQHHKILHSRSSLLENAGFEATIRARDWLARNQRGLSSAWQTNPRGTTRTMTMSTVAAAMKDQDSGSRGLRSGNVAPGSDVADWPSATTEP
ncbi:hypothetical protein CBL_10693 [Carabus blaptoides fortunei]